METTLTAQGTSANEVFKLKNPKLKNPDTSSKEEEFAAFEAKPGDTAAFFKVGRGGEKAAGVMEKMMWDIAVVMGLEEQFVPTGETDIMDASQLKGAQESRRGGIQVAQKGVLLKDYMKNPGVATAKIPKSEINKGALVSVVFGMFDAHAGNIFVTEDGKLKYFDNTRSLPNSNGFINRGDYLVSSYRCSLMGLPSAREKLTKTEIDQLKQDVAAYKEKIERVKKYLNSPQAQAQLNKLPPGWMDLESSIAAMEERVNLVEQALNLGVKTLQDLVVASNPVYKFAFALSYLEAVFSKKSSAYQMTKEGQKGWHYSRYRY